MKKHKLLFMFVAILLCASVVLTACGDTGDTTPPTPPTPPNEIPEEPMLPDLLSYFVIDSKLSYHYTENEYFTKAEEIEGDVIWVEAPDGTELMATEDREVDHFNNEVITVELYRNGEVILTCTESYLLSEKVEKSVNMYFDDGVLVFEVETKDLEEHETHYSREYYTYSATEKPVKLYDGEDVESYKKIGNLTVVVGRETVKWYGAGSAIVFEMTRDFYNEYGFSSGYEYDGYLYFTGYADGVEVLYIFDQDGKCIVEYKAPRNCYETSYAYLNNGNIVIQQQIEVEDGSAEAVFNFYEYGQRYLVKTYIMDYKTGALTEKTDVDFFIEELQSASDAERYGLEFSFGLAEGKENQALIVGFDKDGYDENGKYVVINNDLTVEYVFPIDDANVRAEELAWYSYAIADKYILIDQLTSSEYSSYLFDYYGNAVAPVNEEIQFTDKYIFTEYAVYDYNLNLVYRVSDANGAESIAIVDNKLVVTADSNCDGYPEIAVLDPANGKLTVIADGLDGVFCDGGDNYYVVLEFCDFCKAHHSECEYEDCDSRYCTYDVECEFHRCETCLHKVYSVNGTLLLQSSATLGCPKVEEHSNSLYVTVAKGNSELETSFVIK